jgi:hypothetical protein
MNPIPVGKPKLCSNCQSRSCASGKHLTLPNDNYRHRWVCARCLASDNSPLVKHHVKIGNLNASKEARVATADTCPIGCRQSPPLGCPRATLGLL